MPGARVRWPSARLDPVTGRGTGWAGRRPVRPAPGPPDRRAGGCRTRVSRPSTRSTRARRRCPAPVPPPPSCPTGPSPPPARFRPCSPATAGDEGSGSGIGAPSWREEDADWMAHDEEFEPAMFGDDKVALGSLDETDSTDVDRRPWEFDLDSVRPGAPSPGPVLRRRRTGDDDGSRPSPPSPSRPRWWARWPPRPTRGRAAGEQLGGPRCPGPVSRRRSPALGAAAAGAGGGRRGRGRTAGRWPASRSSCG